MLRTTIFTMALATMLSACAKPNSSDGAKAPNPSEQAKAASVNGVCTQAVIDDMNTLKEKMIKSLQDLAEVMPDTVDEDKKTAAASRLESIKGDMKAAGQEFRTKYGNFTCQIVSYGQSATLDPSNVYAQLDKLDQPPAEAQAPSVIGKDGECTTQFKADFSAMQNGTKPLLKSMMSALGAMIGAQKTGESTEEYQRTIRDSLKSMIASVKNFRQSHGQFACNITDANGTQQVVSSDQMDQQLQTLDAKMLQLH